ncbi:hypothetical protein LTV02_27640 [Nocardia yamanashiensis]|uniref:hypothetical protein n=1 Tax=Nocardia yamanashiensis TaxID=209247 RepID=UPI00082F6C91|nr:hypothetical protein [Nocardia yamanashiensis]UGT39814.1 hypothetical protein LTV02_27640 [Nocardia yamanashiensis]
MVEVELDLYSARPNPAWRLDPVAAQDVLACIAAAPPLVDGRLQRNLGYRGLVVYLPDGRVARIQRGTIEVSRGNHLSCRADLGRALERRLLATGRPEIGAREYAIAAAALRG